MRTQPTDYDYEVDEFIEGDLYHCDAIVTGGQVRVMLSGKYFFPLASFFDDKVCGSVALSVEDEAHRELAALNVKVLKALGMPNGVYHLEAFRTHLGELIFLEVGARPAGALVPEMYEKAFDINLHEAHILAQVCGESPVQPRKLFESFWLWVPPQEGILTQINALSIKSQHEYTVRFKVGECLKKPKEIVDRFGGVLAWDRCFEYLSEDISILTKAFRFFEITQDL